MGSLISLPGAGRRWAPATITTVAIALLLAVGSATASASTPPSVKNVEPGNGPISGGTELHIGGSNLTGATEVRFGSTPAAFSVVSSIRIDAVAPPGSEGTVDVTVTTPEGTSAITRADHFSYVPPGPAVVELLPNEGRVSGGVRTSLFGAHFEGVTEVSFGATSIAYEVISSEHIEVSSPPGEMPAETVRVATLAGISPIWSADTYHYVGKAPEVSTASPNKGPAAGGNSVTVNGLGFYGVTGVEFGTTPALSFKVNSPTSITAVAPPNTAEKTAVTVLTNFGPSGSEFCKPVGQCVTAGPYKFKEPTVTGLTPGSGPRGGGTAISLTGTGFALGASETEILLGAGVATSVDCTSTTACTAVTPPAAKPVTAYIKVTIHADEINKSRKNPAVAFHYE